MHRPFLGVGAACAVALLLVVACAAVGCGGGEQLSGENRELIVSLATAVSTREPKWLDENAALIEKRHDEGTCSDSEYAALKAVVDKAKAGDWDAAQEAAYALRDAQEPTAEDLKNLAERKVSHEPKTLGPKARTSKKS